MTYQKINSKKLKIPISIDDDQIEDCQRQEARTLTAADAQLER